MFKAKFIQLHARRTSLYRVYFVYSLLLCIIPSFVLTLLLVSHNTRSIISQYSRAQTSSLIESGSILDTTIQNAIHISEMPMFSSDIGRAMKTNYKTKYYQFARDTNSFVRQLEQANRVNPNRAAHRRMEAMRIEFPTQNLYCPGPGGLLSWISENSHPYC